MTRPTPIVLLAAALVGCASSAVPTKTPTTSGHGWIVVESQHFSLVTDHDREEGERAVRAMEQLHAMLAETLFPGDDATLRLQVVGFRDKAELRAFAPRGADAFVTDLPFETTRPIVYYGEMLAGTRRVLAHELTHVMVARRFPSLPTWLNEGFAEYASTIEAAGDHVYLGRANPAWRQWIRYHAVPPFEELRTMTRSTFYAKPEGGTELTTDERLTLLARYIGAATAVHMFQNGPEAYRPRFADYVSALQRGERSEAAWSHAFRGVPAEELQRAYERHASRQFEITWRRPYTEHEYAGALAVRELPRGEVLLLEAQLLLVRGRGKEALARLEEGLAAEPQSPRLLRASAVAHPKERGVILRRALALAPEDPDIIAELVEHLERQRAEAGVHEPTDDENALWAALVQHAKTASHYNSVAWHKAHTGNLAVAYAFAKRSVALEPTCYACVDTLAFVLHEKGELDAAIAVQKRAIELVPEGVRDDRLEATLRRYEEEARAKRAPKGATAP